MRKNSGFTLIELLVVVAIIGVLASVVLASLNSARSKAGDARRFSDIKQIRTALELYYNDNGYYPEYTTLAVDCNASVVLAPLVSSGSISSIPVDPKNTNTSTPKLCYFYMGIGTAADYSGVSSWYCSGRPRSDYQYAIHFSAENGTSSYPRLTNSSGVPISEYTYCVTGALR